MADTAAWFPPGMDPGDVTALLDAYPGDPHRAAADAWYDYAAGLDVSVAAEVVSVATGAQSVTYASGSSPHAAATARGDWHRTRARVRSVRVGPAVEIIPHNEVQDEVDDLYDDGTSEWDTGTIDTAEFPPIGG